MTMISYFLAKTDPDTYSIRDLEKEKEAVWDGVHNFQAINCIKSWKTGDRVFVYHSQEEKKIVGLMEVISAAYKDPHDTRGISWVAKVRYLCTFSPDEQVSLKEIKDTGKFSDFLLLRNPRLSTMACPDTFISWIKGRISHL